MADALYLVGTVALFALMLLYVRACETLGRSSQSTDEESR